MSASHLQRLRIVSNGFVELSELEPVVVSLGNLANNAGWLACDNGEAWNDHVWGNDGAIENTDIVLDNGKFVDNGVVANVDVRADTGGLDDGALANKNMVANAKGHVSEDTAADEGGRWGQIISSGQWAASASGSR